MTTVADVAKYETWDKAVLIPVAELVLNDWNPNEMPEEHLAELHAEIEEPSDPKADRFHEPLQVVPLKGQKKWLVLGGEHRARVMKALDKGHIPCVIRNDLAGKSRQELMLWSVKRNNLRGRINAQKYAELEAELVDKHGMTAEAARRAMLVDGALVKALRASLAVRDNEPDDAEKKSNPSEDREKQQTEKTRNQAELLQALKVVEQDVLLDSADTVEHGYLFFVQGARGQTHLVVDESTRLCSLVEKMVGVCKGNNARVDDFLVAAIDAHLKHQE